MLNKRNVTVHKPIIVAQSTTEPIMHGGYQAPFIQCDENGALYVRFAGRRDCPQTMGMEDKNPVYRSLDGVKTAIDSVSNEVDTAVAKANDIIRQKIDSDTAKY